MGPNLNFVLRKSTTEVELRKLLNLYLHQQIFTWVKIIIWNFLCFDIYLGFLVKEINVPVPTAVVSQISISHGIYARENGNIFK